MKQYFTWKKVLSLLSTAVLTPVLFLLSCQSRLIYFPRSYQDSAALAALAQVRGERIVFQTSQGQQVAYYVPAKDGQPALRHLWLAHAGNGSLALDWLPFLQQWDASFSYLLIDYPSYGACQGRPTPAGIRENSVAATEALARHLQLDLQLQVKPRLAVLGHSLGSAAALMAADALDVQSVLLISPFTTMTEMGRKTFGWPLCYLNLHHFDNHHHLAAVVGKGARVILFHGVEDESIPVSMSRELAQAHPQAVTLNECAGQGHNDILFTSQEQIGAAMRALLKVP
jgi:uncharacterized protein